MRATEFIERAAKAYKAGCPELTDAEANDAAEALWDAHKVDGLDGTSPEDMAYEEMSCWDADENI